MSLVSEQYYTAIKRQGGSYLNSMLFLWCYQHFLTYPQQSHSICPQKLWN